MKTEIVNIEEIQDLILAFAGGDFSKRLSFSEDRNERDSIINGINMLGEELEQTTISKNYFKNIYNAVSEILIITDLNGLILDSNNAATNTTQLANNELIKTNIKDLLANTSFDNKIFSKIKDTSIQFETQYVNIRGDYYYLSFSISTIYNIDEETIGFLFIAKDITKEKLQAQKLLNIIVSTQEHERKRLAIDLHDSLGQELNAIKMYLNTLDCLDKADKKYKTTYERCKSMLDNSIENIRDISYDLMPKSLEKGDLHSALSDLVEKLKPIYYIKFECDQKKLNINKNIQIVIYRVCQEFISNSMKHSNASLIILKIINGFHKISFTISDNGIGYSEKKVKLGNGIYNMTTRLNTINTIYTYKSEIGKGTSLTFDIDYENN